ncbi:MAG: SGNH/GDSL hydrolase family protein [Thermodesulfobacteriota bacterium]
MKKKDLLIIGLITMAALGMMEIACRVYGSARNADSDFRFYIRHVDNDLRLDYIVEDPLLMWALLPGYKDRHVTISSQGFRDREYDKKKPDGVFRILCLGDSSTFGFPMPLELTYHALLEERLNREQARSDRRYEVINAGVLGYTSLQGLSLYLFRGAAFKPDLVTAYFGANETVTRFYLSDADILKPGRPKWLRLFVNKWLLRSSLVRVIRKNFSDVSGGESGAKPLKERLSAEDFRQTLLKLKDACDQNGAGLVLISPMLRFTGIDEKREMKIVRYRQVLEQTAAEAGIPLLTIPEMTEKNTADDSTALFQANDAVHPSPAGHLLIMRRLHDFLIENGLLE